MKDPLQRICEKVSSQEVDSIDEIMVELFVFLRL